MSDTQHVPTEPDLDLFVEHANMSDTTMNNCGQCGGSILQSGFRPVCPECLEAFGALLAACEGMIETHGIHGPCEQNNCSECNRAYKKAQAAIAKARRT